MVPIKFGTSGWQGMLGEDFTFHNVRIICQGIAQYLQHEKIGQRGVIIGHDARFLGGKFAKTAAEVLAAHSIPSFLCDREMPTPTISHQILRHQLAGGINISASHNSPEYNGVKFTPAWGGQALPETTDAIEQRIIPLAHGEHVKWLPLEKSERDGLVRFIDPRMEYLTDLERHVDMEVIGRGQLRVVMDPLFGASRGYLDDFLRKAGTKVALLHYWRDPYFGGLRPEPVPPITEELQEAVKREKAHLGLATDGNADRFGIVDQDGTFIEPNLILALLVDYLATTRRWMGGVARSVATTHLIDHVAVQYGLVVHETPVGFKFLGQLLAKEAVVMGVEESAGMSIMGHVPEKDGILACLLVTEMVAKMGKNIKDLLENLFKRVGSLYSQRVDIPVTDAISEILKRALENPPTTFAGSQVVQVNTLDGCKLLLENGSWFLFRPSGAEPIVRCYGEANTPERLEQVMMAGRELFESPL